METKSTVARRTTTGCWRLNNNEICLQQSSFRQNQHFTFGPLVCVFSWRYYLHKFLYGDGLLNDWNWIRVVRPVSEHFFRSQLLPAFHYRVHQIPPLGLNPRPRTDTNCIIYSRTLSSCPTRKLEDYRLLAVCVCLFYIFAANLHIWRPWRPCWQRADSKWEHNLRKF